MEEKEINVEPEKESLEIKEMSIISYLKINEKKKKIN